MPTKGKTETRSKTGAAGASQAAKGGSGEGRAAGGRVADAITQVGVQVVGDAPAMAMGGLCLTLGNSFAMASADSVFAQQQTNLTHQAATAQALKMLLGS